MLVSSVLSCTWHIEMSFVPESGLYAIKPSSDLFLAAMACPSAKLLCGVQWKSDRIDMADPGQTSFCGAINSCRFRHIEHTVLVATLDRACEAESCSDSGAL